ncbi:pimeloyl-ACP methyl ester carboxylesterase [Actinocorallia herbida]|uniref:Pimeloyl-ACP methyl ester carboxylesterase n=1 Tax=Actinocorallia herbida TaxID=58109 RepID=A0A3N1CT72_9ACTN|nr:alpha/beta hydrolase [Actinocorallia herbida]ROO84506.1 pimeloyl-ACP methyl ester carboxylesterase [Actinocorallia herbida]
MSGGVTPEVWERLPSRRVETNGVGLHVVEHGEGPWVVLCHGFPELGYSWRHQVLALAEAGYRTLTPDLRGYGGSDRPEGVEDYDTATICADLVGLLDDVGARDAVFVGHDWGASIVWQLALLHPDRVRAVAGLSVPPSPRAAAPPLSILRRRHGDSFYMCWFQEPGVADAVLARDVRGTLRSDSIDALAAGVAEDPLPRPWLTEEDLAYFVEAFETTGFTPALNYYRNIDGYWARTEHLAGAVVTRPALFVTGSADPVGGFMPAARLAEALADLRGHVVIDGAGHWIQQERPTEVTAALLDFLGSLDR